MEQKKPGKRKTTPLRRSARSMRVVERLREGFGYDEIAREERLTGRLARQNVTQALKVPRRSEAQSAHLQIDRLGRRRRGAAGRRTSTSRAEPGAGDRRRRRPSGCAHPSRQPARDLAH